MKNRFFNLLLTCVMLLISVNIVSAQYSVGQKTTFGSYEQGSGKKPITWLVVKVENNRALLLSESILDEKPYHNSNSSVTWETSSLRRWLNNDFYNTAFTASEKKQIVEVKNVNPDTAGTIQGYYFSTDGGNDTKDKVFLLSIDEATNFNNKFGTWRCYFTPYVGKKGGYAADTNIGPLWWLRSPGADSNCAAMVTIDGILTNCFEPVSTITIGVRPAIWVTQK